MWKRGSDYLNAESLQHRPKLLNAGRIRSVSVAHQQRLGIDPDDVPCLGFARVRNFAENRDSQCLAKLALPLRLGHTVRLSRVHQDQTEIGRERSIVRVHSVERKLSSGPELYNLGSRGFELPAHRFVLRLSAIAVWGMQEPEFVPSRRNTRLEPPRASRRTHQHALQLAHHRVAVEVSLSL